MISKWACCNGTLAPILVRSVFLFMLEKYFSQVNTVKKRYEEYLPLNPSEQKMIDSFSIIEQTCYSNKVEGNSYTLSETRFQISTGKQISGKSVQELYDINNLYRALVYVNSCEVEMCEDFIKTLHFLIWSSTDKEIMFNAGRYRTVRNFVGGIPTCPVDGIDKEMVRLVDWYTTNKNVLHPLELSFGFKYRFLKIHPFIDGNGRVSRVLVNVLLREFSYLDLVITEEFKESYFKALHECDDLKDKYDCVPLIIFLCKVLVKNYESRIDLLEGKLNGSNLWEV